MCIYIYNDNSRIHNTTTNNDNNDNNDNDVNNNDNNITIMYHI